MPKAREELGKRPLVQFSHNLLVLPPSYMQGVATNNQNHSCVEQGLDLESHRQFKSSSGPSFTNFMKCTISLSHHLPAQLILVCYLGNGKRREGKCARLAFCVSFLVIYKTFMHLFLHTHTHTHTHLYLVCFHVEDVALVADSEPKPFANHTHGRDSALANSKGLVLRQVPTTTWNGMETVEYGMEQWTMEWDNGI